MKIKLPPTIELILKLVLSKAEVGDFNYIREKVREKKIFPLIYYYNKNIPEEIRGQFAEDFKKTIFRNLTIIEEAKEVISKLKINNLDFIMLKGWILSQTVYENIGLRPMDDIDILIKKSQKDATANILSSLGYEKCFSRMSKDTYLKREIMLYIDIHYEIITFSQLNSVVKWEEEDVWRNTRYVEVDGEEVRTLGTEENIIYLCYHLTFQHGCLEPLSLVDVHKFIECYQQEINWEKVILLSRKINLSSCVGLVFLIINYYLDEVVPLRVVKELFYFKKFEEKLLGMILSRHSKFSPYLLPIILIDNNILRAKYLYHYIFDNYQNIKLYKNLWSIAKHTGIKKFAKIKNILYNVIW